MDQEEKSAQAENQTGVTMRDKTFKEMLDDYGSIRYQDGRTGDWLIEETTAAEKALLDYVARLEANQMPADFDKMYALYVRAEQRGDPALRDVRFAGYASAFFTRFLRLKNPDWK